MVTLQSRRRTHELTVTPRTLEELISAANSLSLGQARLFQVVAGVLGVESLGIGGQLRKEQRQNST